MQRKIVSAVEIVFINQSIIHFIFAQIRGFGFTSNLLSMNVKAEDEVASASLVIPLETVPENEAGTKAFSTITTPPSASVQMKN